MCHAKTNDFKQRTEKVSVFFFSLKNIYQSLLIVLEDLNKETDLSHHCIYLPS